MQTPGFETYNAILVTREPLTPMAMQTLKLLTDSNYHVEPFQEHELLIDITEHELVGFDYTTFPNGLAPPQLSNELVFDVLKGNVAVFQTVGPL